MSFHTHHYATSVIFVSFRFVSELEGDFIRAMLQTVRERNGCSTEIHRFTREPKSALLKISNNKHIIYQMLDDDVGCMDVCVMCIV